MSGFSRRDFVIGGVAAAAAATFGTETSAQRADDTQRKPVLRLAHLTDIHVLPERGAPEGMSTCLRQVQSESKPDLILFGGDNLMNVDGEKGAAHAKVQLDVWKQVVGKELSVPSRLAIGNHDVLANKPDAGKRWACDAFELPGRYYAFDQAGWKFIVLDSTAPNQSGYKGKLDEDQFGWLQDQLANTPASMPTLILTHIPIICACALFDGDNEKSGNWEIPGAWVHIDARRIKDLFCKHPQVKLALSGHIHLVDRVDYLGVSYLCNGAVSGGWWKGPNQECENGYGVVDLFADGSFAARYITYPWQPRE